MQNNKGNTEYRQSLRQKILETAMSLFVKHGIKKVKMDDVAAALTISKRTLYEVFTDKENLLLSGLKMSRERSEKRMSKIVEENDNVMEIIIKVFKQQLEELRDIDPRFVADLARYPQVNEFFAQEHEHTKELTRRFIKRGIDEGYFLPKLNINLLLDLWGAHRDIVIQQQLYHGNSMESLYVHLSIISLRGICTQRGIAKLDKMMDELLR